MELNNVFVLDDDEIFLFLMEDIFKEIKNIKRINFESNPKFAFEFLDWCKVKKNFPDYIFTDLNMPELDGYEFLKLYEKEYYPLFPKSKVIIITGVEPQKRKENEYNYPFVKGVIVKPVSTEKIAEVLRD